MCSGPNTIYINSGVCFQIHLPGIWCGLWWLLQFTDAQMSRHSQFYYGSAWQCVASAKV